MIVGAPVRRPVLADAGRVASKGRLVLQQTIGPAGGDMQVVLGPAVAAARRTCRSGCGSRASRCSRSSAATTSLVDDDAEPAGYLVRRSSGAEPLWGARTRDARHGRSRHARRRSTGIYVHTKAIIVDDVFVGIGSCNTNRRGFFHDGEITAFAVPEQLKASRENPALNLRTALWAEHLGIPPAMGRALLADPVAAFELFRQPDADRQPASADSMRSASSPSSAFPSECADVVKMLATVRPARRRRPRAVRLERVRRPDHGDRPRTRPSGPELGTV